MEVLALHPELKKYLFKRGLVNKFQKQVKLFIQNPFHPSLHTELLEPRHLRFWSLRVGKRFRAIFIFRAPDKLRLLTLTIIIRNSLYA